MNPIIFTDFMTMMKAIAQFSKENPRFITIPVDSPPYIAFVSYDPKEPINDMRGWWKISLSDTKRSGKNIPKCVEKLCSQPGGRMALIDKLKSL